VLDHAVQRDLPLRGKSAGTIPGDRNLHAVHLCFGLQRRPKRFQLTEPFDPTQTALRMLGTRDRGTPCPQISTRRSRTRTWLATEARASPSVCIGRTASSLHTRARAINESFDAMPSDKPTGQPILGAKRGCKVTNGSLTRHPIGTNRVQSSTRGRAPSTSSRWRRQRDRPISLGRQVNRSQRQTRVHSRKVRLTRGDAGGRYWI
jgi:hypothetical protein